jgi:hypothetical protein
MTKSYDTLPADLQEQIALDHALDEASAELAESLTPANESYISFQSLYRFATGQAEATSALIREQLMSDPDAVGSLRAILKDLDAIAPPRLAAASTEGIPGWQSEDNDLRVMPAVSDDHEQAHLLIDLGDAKGQTYERCFVFLEGKVQDIEFEMVDGRAHILLDPDSDVFRAISDLWSELWII